MLQKMPKPGTVLMAAVIAVIVGLFAMGVPGAMGAEFTCQLGTTGISRRA